MENRFGHNRFNNHAVGLQLGDNTNPVGMIGEQDSQENVWLGTSSPVEAQASNLANAQSSVFKVNSSDIGSDYWPSPRKIGTADDNMKQWFKLKPGVEPSDEVICLPIGPPLPKSAPSDRDKEVMSGIYSSPFGLDAMAWEAKWQFTNDLNANFELRELDPAVAEYYHSTYNAPCSRLSRAYLDYLNRWTVPAAVKQAKSDHISALEGRFALEGLLADAGTTNAALRSQMLDMDADIANKAILLKAAEMDWAADVSQKMADLLEDLGTIECDNIFEEDLKSVLSVLIGSHFTGDALDAEQLGLISPIADKCRYAGGYAVALARSCFTYQDTYSQDMECISQERGIAANTPTDAQISITPNPARESVTLSIANPTLGGMVRIFNGLGVLMLERTIADRKTILPLTGLSSGVYHAVITNDGTAHTYKTFIKQ